MRYELDFLADALKEWEKLDPNTREQFRKKLAERCENPRVPSSKLRDAANRYKIKLRSVGYRLIYEVLDKEIVVLFVAIGRRESSDAYEKAAIRSR